MDLSPRTIREIDDALTCGYLAAAQEAFATYRAVLVEGVREGALDPADLARFDAERDTFWTALLAIVEAGDDETYVRADDPVLTDTLRVIDTLTGRNE